jgi:predicted transcriptional regulator
MPFTDKNGRVWPDTMNEGGVQYILDPFATQKANDGRPKYRPDPKQQQQYAEQYGFKEKDPKQVGPYEGMALAGGVAATPVIAQQIGKSVSENGLLGSLGLGGETAKTGLSEVGSTVLGNTTAGAGEAATSLASLDNFGQVPAFSLSPTAGADIVGETTALAPETSTLGAAAPYLGAAGVGLGAYGIKEAIDSGNVGQGAISGAGMGLGAAAAAPLLGYGAAFGLGPVGWAALALGGAGLGGGLTSLLGHESTRDAAAKKTKDLMGVGKDNPAWQNYVAGMREQYNTAPTGPAYAGKYNTWDEYQKAGLQANDLTGVYGNMKAFGPEWAALDEAKRQQVTQALIDAGLYASKKGDVILTDEERAKQIYQNIIKPAQQQLAAVGTAPAAVTPVAQPVSQNRWSR